MKLILTIVLIVCSAIVIALLLFAILGAYGLINAFDYLYGEEEEDNDSE